MNKERVRERLADYQKALFRLKEALEEDTSNPLLYDAVIQRFEFTYELAWKLLKAYLELEGISDVNTPRKVFKEAFSAGLIGDGDVWISMIEDRNLTVHTYDEKIAQQIYLRVKEKYFSKFYDLERKMKEVIEWDLEFLKMF